MVSPAKRDPQCNIKVSCTSVANFCNIGTKPFVRGSQPTADPPLAENPLAGTKEIIDRVIRDWVIKIEELRLSDFRLKIGR